MTDAEDTPDAPAKPQPPKPTQVLVVLVRREGRVRISARDVAELHPRAKLDVRMLENGDCCLTYREPADE